MDRVEHNHREEDEGPIEIALVGDLTDNESELTERLLSVPPNGECTLFIDSPGGSPYCAIALTTLIRLRGIRATGVVTGECSSATLWPFAACERRIVTPYSVLLFHPMKWQSEEHVGLSEAAEWARHFGALETDMDNLLAEMLGVDPTLLATWINPGRYVSGREFAEAGMAELVTLGRSIKPLHVNDQKLIDVTAKASAANVPAANVPAANVPAASVSAANVSAASGPVKKGAGANTGGNGSSSPIVEVSETVGR